MSICSRMGSSRTVAFDSTTSSQGGTGSFLASLEPLRSMFGYQPFLGGDGPLFADYIVFGAFQWARVVSPFKLLAEEDPVYAWRERLLDAFDGMARKSPSYHA